MIQIDSLSESYIMLLHNRQFWSYQPYNMHLKRISRLKMPWSTHKRQPASSWRGCHLSWHYLTTRCSNPTNQTTQHHQHDHWCIPAIPSIPRNGKTSATHQPSMARLRHVKGETPLLSHLGRLPLLSRPIDGASWLVGWFMEITAWWAGRMTYLSYQPSHS